MKRLFSHLQTHVLRGLIALIPVGLCALAVRFLYTEVDRRVATLLDHLVGRHIPGLGILLVAILLYLLGLVASNFVGRGILASIGRLLGHLPIVRTIYRMGKEVSTALSMHERQVFKSVVLVECLRPGIWVVGFVTGYLAADDGSGRILKVFVPTPPNPASGTVILVRESDARDPGWTIEEGLRTVVSGGIIGPEQIRMPAALPAVSA
jgi:uncharacterized membrane protein